MKLLLISFIFIALPGCEAISPAEPQISTAGNNNDTLCIRTAEFLRKVVNSQQDQIDSLRNELNQLSTVIR